MRVAAAALAALLLGACAETTIDDGTGTTAAGVTTTAPSGSPDELLARLSTRAYLLSSAIVEGQGQVAMDELESLWTAATAQLPRTDFVLNVEHQLSMMRNAVERKRPADADKAARHIDTLVDARS
jgi:hypothetical protein